MIRVTLDSVGVGTGVAAALPPVSLEFETGVPVAFGVETEQRPTVLSLVASGRMKPDAGTVTATVTATGSARAARLADRIALVDTPLVAEPDPALRVRTVVTEEFVFAGVRRSVKAFLAERELADYANAPISALPPVARLRLLADLALLRPGIEALVLTSPERHGGHPQEWWHVARELAARDIAVLVVTDQASVDAVALLPHPELHGPGAVPLFEGTWS
jgi:ABC-2 type transport system ATP-binding protein